jgi:hypothetical protein
LVLNPEHAPGEAQHRDFDRTKAKDNRIKLDYGHPGIAKRYPDCVCRIANANAEDGPKGERQGWRK